MTNPTLAPPPLPLHDPVVNQDRTLSRPWTGYLVDIMRRLGLTPLVFTGDTLADQEASIGTTAIEGQDLEGGNYRVSYYAAVTRAATTSSGLTIAISWIDGGITRTFTGAAMAANTTAQYQTDSFPVRSDPGTAVSYFVTYVSVGGTTMRYSLSVTLERLP